MNLEREVPKPQEPKHPGKQDEPPEPEEPAKEEPEEDPERRKISVTVQ